MITIINGMDKPTKKVDFKYTEFIYWKLSVDY